MNAKRMENGSQDPPPRDIGLQPERTALAWTRTALVLLVNGMLALRTGWAASQTAITVLALSLLLAAGLLFAYAAYRRRHLLDGIGTIAPPVAAVAGVTAITLMACTAEIVSITTR